MKGRKPRDRARTYWYFEDVTGRVRKIKTWNDRHEVVMYNNEGSPLRTIRASAGHKPHMHINRMTMVSKKQALARLTAQRMGVSFFTGTEGEVY